MHRLRQRATIAVATMASLLVLAAPASAHVQVLPTEVAPNDPVRFTVIVPGEKGEPTVEVELQVPKDVLPFSYGDTPGWKRELLEGADGSIESIKWTGRAAPDGFAEFSFLASTPETEGTLEWKALQTYEGGDVVRWIGTPDTEYPAAITTVSADAARQNAGGEGAGDEPAGETEAPTAIKAVGAGASTESEGDDDSPLPLVLSIAALLLSFGAFVLGVRKHRR